MTSSVSVRGRTICLLRLDRLPLVTQNFTVFELFHILNIGFASWQISVPVPFVRMFQSIRYCFVFELTSQIHCFNLADRTVCLFDANAFPSERLKLTNAVTLGRFVVAESVATRFSGDEN